MVEWAGLSAPCGSHLYRPAHPPATYKYLASDVYLDNFAPITILAGVYFVNFAEINTSTFLSVFGKLV